MGDDNKFDQLLRDALKSRGFAEPPAGGACRNDEALAAYVEDRLSVEERESVEEHLAGCRACRLALAALTQAQAGAADEPAPEAWLREAKAHFSPLPGKQAASPPQKVDSWLRRWFTLPRLAPMGAALIAAGLIVMVMTSMPEKEPVQLAKTSAQPIAEQKAEPASRMPAADSMAADTGPEGAGAPMPRAAALPEPAPMEPAASAPRVASIPQPTWQKAGPAEPGMAEEKSRMYAAHKTASLESLASKQQTAARPKAAASAPPPPAGPKTAAAPAAGLSLVSVKAGGGYDSSLVESQVRKVLPKISSCYAKSNSGGEDAADLVARLLIDKNGRVVPAGEQAQGALGKCLRAYWAPNDLPKPAGDESVALTLEFSAK